MSKNFQKYESLIKSAEEEVRNLSKEVTNISNSNEDVPEEFSLLATENIKLKHRLAILKRAVGELEPGGLSCSDKMIYISAELEKLFSQAIAKAFPDIPEATAVIVLSPKFSDYQCNSAMSIVKSLKAQGQNMSPRDVGLKLVENVPCSFLISKLDVAGPGFINISINKEYGLQVLSEVLQKGVQPPPLEKKHRVVIDMSSPNIAKQMHVGHLRSTIIGESISRLLEFLGHDVLRINHIGDWGTQFGMLIAHLKDKFPNYLNESAPIADLATFYKESKRRFDEDEVFKKRAYADVVKLQSFDPDIIKAWKMICDVSRTENQRVYDRLEISIEERGESFYQTRMEKLVAELEAKGVLEDDEGRKIMWGREKQEGDIPFTIVKSDGGFTYDTSDMATIRNRIEEENGDWLIYVVDLGQGTHFKLLQQCAERVGIFDPKKVRFDHVGFGVVLGEDKKKFKSRSGETVRLSDLLDEGMKRSLDKLKEKGRDQVLNSEELTAAQESVAYGCIKYADLLHNRHHAYEFSFDKMLEDKGNTAVYLLYAYTRIRAIARLANLTAEQLSEAAKTTPVSLDHEKEWKLAKVLIRFPDELRMVTNDLCLHHLCEYVYEISTKFSEFYDSCYCVEKNSAGEVVKVHIGRVLLAEVTALIMAKCFHILGLKPVMKM